MKPAVDRLETALTPQIPLLRLDIRSSLGRQYAVKHGVQVVPTLIVLDKDRMEVGRFHLDVPSAGKVVLLMATPAP